MRVKIVECFAQSFGRLLVRLDNHCLEVDGQTVSEHRLDKQAQRFHVNGGRARLAEIYLQPSDKWSLNPKSMVKSYLENKKQSKKSTWINKPYKFVLLVLLESLDLLVVLGDRLLVVVELAHQVLFVARLDLERVDHFLEHGHVHHHLITVFVQFSDWMENIRFLNEKYKLIIMLS